MQKSKLILLLTIILLGFSINAQIVTERPTQSESASTLPKNSFQIESGMIYQKSGDSPRTAINITAPSTLFRYGLFKFMELRVISSYQNDIFLNTSAFPNIYSGFNDMEVGTKIQIFKKENSKTEIAFLTHLVVPTGSTLFTDNNYASINKIAVSHSITDFFGVGYNVGYKYFTTGDNIMLYSLSLGFNVTDKFGFFIEPYGDLIDINTHNSSINGGIFYQLKENLQADFSLGTGINHQMNFFAVGFGWNISSKNKDS